MSSQKSNAKAKNIEFKNPSRVAVIGAGPAGSFFSYFLLDMAKRIGIDVQLDIYEPRDFSSPGPAGCNMCGGVISESLVQILATEGINLPPTVVQRGIDSYVIHTDVGSVRIATPLNEKRIAVVHRGSGPREVKKVKWGSFDEYLLKMAVSKGANQVKERVSDVSLRSGRPKVKTRQNPFQSYDLLAVAVGVNTNTLKLFNELEIDYKPPKTTRTYICELYLGQKVIKNYFGSSLHIFLLNIPRLEFAAIVPKGEYATVCLIGEEIDKSLVQSFLNASEVKGCFPPKWHTPKKFCHCSPRINIKSASQPFNDRVLFIGDCGTTRYYKDGIGAAYRTAKVAAKTVVFKGISTGDFRRHFWPACRDIDNDNKFGKIIFATAHQIQKMLSTRRGILRMIRGEQQKKVSSRRMSLVLWDTFTGSAPYRNIFLSILHPFFILRFLWSTVIEIFPKNANRE